MAFSIYGETIFLKALENINKSHWESFVGKSRDIFWSIITTFAVLQITGKSPRANFPLLTSDNSQQSLRGPAGREELKLLNERETRLPPQERRKKNEQWENRITKGNIGKRKATMAMLH